MADKSIRAKLATCAAFLLTACTGGVHQSSSGGTTGSTQYTVGGTVSGLNGSGLVLASNTGETLPVAADGSFTFKTTFPTGNPYYVLVLTQPSSPSQTCLASNGAGTVQNASVTSITVLCTNKTVAADAIGGMVVGVTGSGLVLQNNGTDNLAIAADGSFKFPTALPSGSQYDVTVLSPPINPYEDCVVLNGKGTTADSDIASIAVACTVNGSATHTIGGTVTGVSGTLILEDNGRDDLTITADGPFKFPLAIPSGGSYNVTTKSANGAQSQACTFTNATGMVSDSDITNVTIVCVANTSLKASVSGLSGTGLVIQNTVNGDTLGIGGNGTWTFSAGIGNGGSYNVTVAAQPSNPSQTCVVTNGAGTGVAGATVTVTCTTNTYTVGGVVTGLPDPNSGGTLNLVIQDNVGDSITIAPTANSPVSFNFATPIASGSAYSVVVASQPGMDTSFGTPGVVQTSTVCVIPPGTGTGTVTSANVTNIVVNCVRPLGFAYVANSGADDRTISPYLIDSATGALLPSGWPVRTGSAPSSITANTASSQLYVSNSGSNDLSGYSIDPNTGTLIELNGSPFALGLNAPSSVAVYDAVEPGLYVTNAGNGTISAFTTNNAPTSFPPITNSPFTARAGATAGLFFFGGAGLNQIYYYLEADAANDTVSAWAVDPELGSLTLAQGSPAATEATPDSVAAIQTFLPASGTPVDYVYVANSGANTISTYSMNTQNGALTVQGALNTPAGLRSLVMSGTYLLATTSQGVLVYATDATGALTPVANSPFAAGAAPGPLAAIDNFVYVVDTLDGGVSMFSRDPATGTLTPVPGTRAATGQAPAAIKVIFRPQFGPIG